MENSTETKMITLKSLDGKEFTVPEAVAMQSQVVRHLIEDGHVPNALKCTVKARILEMLITYCEKHVDAAKLSQTDVTDGQGPSIAADLPRMSEEELRDWDKQFVDVDLFTLCELHLAANDLGIVGLLRLTSPKVNDIMIWALRECALKYSST
jgi:S-phase kinase-associated protein 1